MNNHSKSGKLNFQFLIGKKIQKSKNKNLKLQMTEDYMKAAIQRDLLLDEERNRRLMLKSKLINEKNDQKNFRIQMTNYRSGQSRYEYQSKI